MRRFLIGLAIGSITFLIGMVPFYYPFEGLFIAQGGLSDCVVRWEPSTKNGMPSGGGISNYSDEGRAVYAAVIDDEIYRRSRLIVSEITVPGDWFAGIDPDRQLSGVEKATFDGYVSSNLTSRYVRREIGEDPRITFLSEHESIGIFNRQRNGWAEFRKRFPDANGFITFSEVGFNPTFTQALVSVEKQCGGLCGEGKFVVLKKINGRWMIMRKVYIWNS